MGFYHVQFLFIYLTPPTESVYLHAYIVKHAET